MEMKFYSPLTAEFFPDEPDWEDESYNEYEGYPMDGHDLLQYADAVDEAVKKDIADTTFAGKMSWRSFLRMYQEMNKAHLLRR